MCNSFVFFPVDRKSTMNYREEYYETICQMLALCTAKVTTL